MIDYSDHHDYAPEVMLYYVLVLRNRTVRPSLFARPSVICPSVIFSSVICPLISFYHLSFYVFLSSVILSLFLSSVLIFCSVIFPSFCHLSVLLSSVRPSVICPYFCHLSSYVLLSSDLLCPSVI